MSRTSSGYAALMRIGAALYATLNAIYSVINLLNPRNLGRKWRYRRYGNRYTLDEDGGVIYKQTIWDNLRKYIAQDASYQQNLLLWAQSQIPEFRLADFSKSWSDGIALCALMEAVCPGACPRYDLLRRTHKINNCRLALKTINKILGIPMSIISAEDLMMFSRQYQTKIEKLIALIRWAATHKSIKDIDNGKSYEKRANLATLVKYGLRTKCCFASGCGLGVGLTEQICKFDLHIPTNAELDISITVYGPSENIIQEHITTLFPKRHTGSLDQPLKDARALSLWKVGAAKLLTAGGRKVIKSTQLKDCPQIREQPPITIQYHVIAEGHISVHYIPPTRGQYSLSIKWHKSNIFGSPFQIMVKDTIDDLNCWDGQELPMKNMQKLPTGILNDHENNGNGIEEIVQETADLEKRDSEVIPSGVTAAVLNRSSKVQRSISRMGGPLGNIPLRATVTRRRVLKQVITKGGQDIVIHEVAPTPPSSVSFDTNPDSESSNNTSVNSNTQDTNNKQAEDHRDQIPVKSNGIMTTLNNQQDKTYVLAPPPDPKKFQASPFSPKLDGPNSEFNKLNGRLTKDISNDSEMPKLGTFEPSDNKNVQNKKDFSPKYFVSSNDRNKSIKSQNEINATDKTGTFSSLDCTGVQTDDILQDNNSNPRQLASDERTSTLSSLCKDWNAFEIDTDDTSMSLHQMEEMSIAAQRHRRASLGNFEQSTDFEHSDRELCESSPKMTHHPSENVTARGISANQREKQHETHDKPSQMLADQVSLLREFLPNGITTPKPTKDKWTQVSYDEIISATSWVRPTTYVRPRRRRIYGPKLEIPYTAINPVPINVYERACSPENISTRNTMPADQNQNQPSRQLTTETTDSGIVQDEKRNCSVQTSSLSIKRNNIINGHQVLQRNRYRGNISLDPRLTRNSTSSPTKTIDFPRPWLIVKHILKMKNSRSSTDGKKTEGDSHVGSKIRRRNVLKKRVKFCRRVLMYRQSSSRSSRNSKQSYDELAKHTPSIQETLTEVQEDKNQDFHLEKGQIHDTKHMIHESLLRRHKSNKNSQELADFMKTYYPHHQQEPVIIPTEDTIDEGSTSEKKSQDSIENLDGFGVSASTRKDLLGEIDAFSRIGSEHSNIDTLVAIKKRRMSAPERAMTKELASWNKLKRSMSATGYQLSLNENDKSMDMDAIPTEEASERVAEYLQTLLRIKESDVEDDLSESSKHTQEEGNAELHSPTLAHKTQSAHNTSEQIPNPTQYNYVPDPYRCKAFGAHLSYGAVGVTNMFQVHAPTENNGSLCVTMSGPRPRTIKETCVTFTGDDLYEVTFEVTQPGPYVINVKWGDVSIPNSPFVCQVSYDS